MSVSRTTEVERKYAVPDGAGMPAFDEADEVVAVAAQPVARLDAVYLDTEDRTLLRARIALRRRTGGHDAGWHVKLAPVEGGRTELHAAIDDEDPESLPAPFARALASRLRGRPVAPIARIRTERHGLLVSGPDGACIEVVDDHVAATDLAAGVLRSWREWEAEQVGEPDASAALLETVDAALRLAGATPSASPAKLAQALGLDRLDAPRPAPTTAGEALAARVAALAEDLHRGMTALALDGDPDGRAVHALRRTVRQVRSLLSLQEVAGPSGADLRERLGDLGAVLGEVRDPRVSAAVAEGLLDELPPGTPGLLDARRVLVDARLGRQPALLDALRERLAAAAVHDVLAALEAWEPDGERAAAKPKALVALAERAVLRGRRRARRALGGGLEELHRARKAAKRARFVVEELVAAGLVGVRSATARDARRAERAQDALGAHRDLALLLEALPSAAEELAAAGGNAFALGRIAERGERHLALLLLEAERAVRRLG